MSIETPANVSIHSPKGARPAGRAITLTVDGVSVQTVQGKTVLHAAIEAGVYIPHLCDYHDLTPFAGCRMCLVEVEGMRGLETACTVAAREGMVVRTNTALARQHQRGVLEVLLSDHPDRCLNCPRMERCGPFVVCQRDDTVTDRCVTCPRNKNCELQRVVDFVQWREQRFFNPRRIGEPERSNPFIERYPDYCIYCARCVRVCDEVIGVSALGLAHRGMDATIAVDFEKPLTESGCIYCGRCAVVCPTGALMKADSKYGATPTESTTPSVCTYCSVGCSMFLNTQNGRLANVMADREGASNHDNLCVRGQFAYDYAQHRDRLKVPRVRQGTTFVDATWDSALDRVASDLRRIRQTHGPDAIAFVGSGKITNEESYLLQKFARAVVGTNNIDEPTARYCYEPTLRGLHASFGSAGATIPTRDLESAGCVIVIGSHTVEAHPVLSFWVKRVVRRGGRMILIDPRATEMARLASMHLRPHPGTDLSLLAAMLKVIIDEEMIDRTFIESRVEGYDELAESVATVDLAAVERETGVPAEEIRQAARLYATGGTDKRYPVPGSLWGEIVWPGQRTDTSNSVITYASGVAQQADGEAIVRAIASLALITGQIGKPASGVFPLAGQNNTVGSVDMGCLPDWLPGHQPLTSDPARAALAEAWQREIPAAPGRDLDATVEAIERGEIKALYVVGANPARSIPDTERVLAAFRKLDLLVVQDIFPTETAELATVILPASSAKEKDGTFTSTERRIQRVNAALRPIGQSRPDWRILVDLAARFEEDSDWCQRQFAFGGPSDIADEIARVVPTYRGLAYDAIGIDGVQWPLLDRATGAATLYESGFERGRGRVFPVRTSSGAVTRDETHPFIGIFGRAQLWNTDAMSSRSRGLARMWGEHRAQVNASDAARLGIGDGDLIAVASAHGRLEIRVTISEIVAAGQVFVPIHHPDANRLQASRRAGRGMKGVALAVTRLAGPAPTPPRRSEISLMDLPLLPVARPTSG